MVEKTPEKKSLKDKWKEYQLQAQEQRDRTALINELVMNWQNTMGNLQKWNHEKKGYTLHSIEITDYGFKCRIYAPWGMNIFELENLKPFIDTGLRCEFIYNIPNHNQFALVKFVYPEQVKINEKPFVPYKVKPWEFFAGYDIAGDPVIFNLNETPHILIAGQQRRGKNGAVYHAIVSWIHYCQPDDVMLYCFQGAKNDLIKFKDCKHCYCYTEDVFQICEALEHIMEELKRRTQLFAPMMSKADGNDNIYHYNRLNPARKLPYEVIIIDEFITLMPDKVDGGEIKKKKELIMYYLQQIGQWGGSYGINYVVLHQKPEKELMPTFVKNMSSVRICFGFEDLVCCSIVLGDALAKYAHKLPPRRAYFSNNEIGGYLYTSDLKGRIREFIEPAIEPNHRTLFGDMEKLKRDYTVIQNNEPETTTTGEVKVPEPIKEEIATPEENAPVAPVNIDAILEKTMNLKINTSLQQNTPENSNQDEIAPTIVQQDPQQKTMHFHKVDPGIIVKEQRELRDNISRIPDFVPFIDYAKFKNIKIIDQTHFDPSKTEKPKKAGDSKDVDAADG